jgi:hypothetical protein
MASDVRLTTPAKAGLLALLLWSAGWKAASVWRAARDGDRRWYAALWIVNSAGLLDAIYLFVVSPRRRR